MEATAEAKRARPSEVLTRPITVAEYYRMGEAGILGVKDRVELVDGRLMIMPPISPPHDYTVRRLVSYLATRFAGRASVGAQGPVTLDEWSEPQPDIMLNALPEERYAVEHPSADDVLLLVEVASSSLRKDSGLKRRVYARRGIRDYWIVDLVHERVEVYRGPSGERYKHHHRVGRGQSVAPLAFPDDAIAVDDILPPRR